MRISLKEQEVFDILKLGSLYQALLENTKLLEKAEVLDKDTKKYLKHASTLIYKVFDDIILNKIDQRLPVKHRMYERMKKMELLHIDSWREQMILARINKEESQMFKRQEVIYNFAESLFEFTCKNCTKANCECDYFSMYFDEKLPTPRGEEYPGKQCDYGYEGRLD